MDTNSNNTVFSVKAKITWVNSKLDSSKKASASVTIADSFTVNDLSVMEGSKGLFVSMPQRSYEKNGEKKYLEIAHPVNAEMRKAINDAVLGAYSQKMAQESSNAQNIAPDMPEEIPAPFMGQVM